MQTMTHLALMAVIVGVAAVCGQETAPAPKEYTGNDLHGDDVIACWQFNAGQETKDSSGKKHDLQLRGQAEFTADGRFGGGLRSTGGGSGNDKPQGATARNRPEFSPAGAFSVDLWMKASPELYNFKVAYLVDKKYFNYTRDTVDANGDYMFYLAKSGEDRYVFTVSLGFEKDSVWARSQPIEIVPEQWYHAAFSYDGAGVVRIFLDGKMICRAAFEGRGPVFRGKHPLIIGDRVGSIYASFPGVIDQVRLINGLRECYDGQLEFVIMPDRTVFRRFEKNAGLQFKINNDTSYPVTGIVGTVTILGRETPVNLSSLQPRESHVLTLPVDVTLKPGSYDVKALIRAEHKGVQVTRELACQYHVVPRPLPFMPVVMWGTGDIERLLDMGFTHDMRHLGNLSETWETGAPVNERGRSETVGAVDTLNRHALAGLRVCLTTRPGSWVNRTQTEKEFKRVDRSGNPNNPDNAAVAHPRIQQFGYNLGAGIAQTYGHFPNFDAALIHSEVRDSTSMSFHDYEVASAREYLNGKDIPLLAQSKGGVSYKAIPGFPASRIIPDDYDLLRFYTWFWKVGDGWNPLHSKIHHGLKSTGRHDLWTFFDPAVRAPSVWGSGGEVDVISQWTYSYPDPIKIGQATDELFAMSEGVPGQKVMKMTQIIWYRSRTAPQLPADEKDRVAWEKEIPDAKFITISPDHLSETLWSMIARPVRGIMYHGWGSLVTAPHTSYRFTNPDTPPHLKKLTTEVIKPLGPTLLQIPDRKADIAILESFSSQIFAGRGSNGWSGSWEADVHLVLQWASLQPQVVYEETIRKNGLGQYKVLVMPNCDVLTESVVKEIHAFQRRGGIVVADERLCPGVLADILVPVRVRTSKPDVDKAALQQMAATLLEELLPFYQRHFWTDNADLVPRMRQFGDSEYLFIINDKRTFGNYVGQHGLVMEDGLPNAGTVSVARAGRVYDLCAHQEIKTTVADGVTSFPVALGPGEGRLFLITPTPLQKTILTLPQQASRPSAHSNLGAPYELQVRITDGRGKSANAVVPLAVRIVDPNGQEAEYSGYHAAVNGALDLTLQPAINDTPGVWTVTVDNLASGETVSKTVTLE